MSLHILINQMAKNIATHQALRTIQGAFPFFS